MRLKVLIAPDKFKSSLTAREAARAIARGWRRVRPRDAVRVLPVTDGGDGFGEVMSALRGARVRTVRTVNAARLGRMQRTAYLINKARHPSRATNSLKQ
jgi:glycerate 2-kinase